MLACTDAGRAKWVQSLVQTLVLLPVIVAGVVLMVKNSTALAFSLGGIVGAVFTSFTVTVNWHCVSLPCMSVTVYVTVVSPTGKASAGLFVSKCTR